MPVPPARVRIGDMDVYNGTSAVQIRRRIGMVFQKANPFPTMSIYDNVAAGLTLNGFHDRKRLDEIVERSLRALRLWDEVKDRCTRSRAPASPEASSSVSALRAPSRSSRKCC